MLFRADELFQVSVDKNAAFPLNLEFIAKEPNKSELQGSGIFFMTYKDELLYIGYAIQQDALLRMKMQLEGATLRGKGIAFNDLSVRTIQNSSVLSPFFNEPILNRRKGYIVSERRVLFAENHWKDFSSLDECILKNFAFDWFAVETNVAESCELLKEKFHPRCNRQGFLPRDFERAISQL